MSTKILRETGVNRPTPAPLTSSILDHASVDTIASFGMRNNEGLWPSYNCLDTLVPTELCPDPMDGADFKDFQYAGWVPGFEFAVHGGVQCQALGLDAADMESELGRVFAANEGRGVERALLHNRFVATGSDSPVQWEAPQDVTPPVPVPLHVALALLEGYAAQKYAGLPTIHMPRAAASLLNERIVWKDGIAYTRLGSKVAVGGGYDELISLDGTWEMYATGEVYVERSDTVAVRSFVLPGDGSGIGSDQNGLSDNTVIALVERMYRVAIDCFSAKVTGTVWS